MVLFLCGLFDFFSAAAQTKQKAKERSRSPRQLTGFKYPDHLDEEIVKLEEKAEKNDPKHPHETPPGRKRWLLMRARDQLASLGFKVEMTSHTLPNEKDYEQSKTVFPKYFDEKFNDYDIVIKHHGQWHYTYDKKEEPEEFQVWVDFANMRLGGGVFTDGFVQEETMFLETPELANVAACDQITRSIGAGVGAGVLEGSPRPMLFRGVHRVIEFQQDPATIDVPHSWKSLPYDDPISHKDLKHGARRLSNDEAQHIIVLAMAAPNRSLKGSPGQWSVDTLRDLFNTFVAGFQLSRDVAEGKVGRQAATTPAGRRHAAANLPILINTGAIGAGDFDNNRTVVAVLQVLAARQVGKVNVKLWGYDHDHEVVTVKNYVDSIQKAYKNSQTKTIKHLIELTFDTFEKTPRPVTHTPVGNPPASQGLDTRAPEGGRRPGLAILAPGT